MATKKWALTTGNGNWSTTADWTPSVPAAGDDVFIGTTSNSGAIKVTEDVTAVINSLTMAGKNNRATTLVVTPSATLTVSGTIAIGANSIINGTGALVANGAISGGGAITASSGLLDVTGTGSIASGGAVLSVGTATASTLELNLSGGVTSAAITLNNANQTLEVGPLGSLTFTAAQNINKGKLLLAGGTVTDGSGITLGNSSSNGTLIGSGTVAANLTRSGSGTADVITASKGTLDLKGSVGSGLVLAIDASAPADLKLDSQATVATAIAISNANQKLEIGAAGALTISVAESITNGTIQLDGGTLTDAAGVTVGSGALLVGSGKVAAALSGAGTVKASGGLLNIAGNITSTATTLDIDTAAGSVLKMSGTVVSGATLAFLGASGVLELANVANGTVQNFKGTIAGLNVGASAAAPTNAVNVQAAVTQASLSGNTLTVSNGATVVATLVLSAAPAGGTYAYVAADSTLGGNDVFLSSELLAPTVGWSSGAASGTEGGTVALGTIALGGGPASALTVSGIPGGDTLTDGTHSFVAPTGTATATASVLGWNLGALTIKPVSDTNFSLSVEADNATGTAGAGDTVTVAPLAPGLAPVAASGTVGHAIALSLGVSPNGLSGDANSLSVVTISGLPTGATLSNTNGDPLPISSGTISFTAGQLAAGVLNGLAVTSPTAGTFALRLAATEADAEGDPSVTATGTETLTVAPVLLAPTVTWSPGTASGTEGATVALGTIALGGGAASSLAVSGIPGGDTLTDGTHSFVAPTGTASAATSVLGWSLGALTIKPVNDANFSLSVQVGNATGTASAGDAVTVAPLAPTLAPVSASGTIGHAIALNLGVSSKGLSGDVNSLSSVTISGLPTGATLTNTNGNALTISNGSIAFTAAQLAAAVLNGLAVTSPTAGTFALGLAAVEADAQGDPSATAIGTETLTVAGTLGSGGTISTSVTGPITLSAATNPLTITSTGTVTATASGADAIDGDSGATWFVTNSGKIASSTGSGLALIGPGTISNKGAVTGVDGLLLRGGGSVSNTGSIGASGALGGGPSVGAGVYITGAPGTVTNSGTITGPAYGVAFYGGGMVTNTKTIIGGEDGVGAWGVAATVDNSGIIIATADDGVGLLAGGYVLNRAGGTISCQGNNPDGAGIYGRGATTVTNAGRIDGIVAAVVISNGLGTVTNTGSITGTAGIKLTAGGQVTNAASGKISASYGIALYNVGGTITNIGTLNTYTWGVAMRAGGSLTNTGYIYGDWDGVWANGVASVDNAGIIIASEDDVVALYQGGSVVNEVGGNIFNNGTRGSGVYVMEGAGTVTNWGSISGIGSGVQCELGGSVTNNAGGTISGQSGVVIVGGTGSVTNTGSIVGTVWTGIRLQGGGQVTNGSGGSISGLTGISIYGGNGTVTNSGTISGTSSAVSFSGSGANRLVVGATSVIIGTVNGSTASGSTNTLEMAAGSGTLSGLTGGTGTAVNNGQAWYFTNFPSLAVDAGASWTVSGTNTIANLRDSGTLAIADSGSLNVTAALDPASTGLFGLGSNAVLDFAGDVGAGMQVAFQTQSGVLELADIVGGVVRQFNGTISGLNVGSSTIVPTNAINIQTTVTGAVLSGNTITVRNGATTVATLVLSAAPGAGSAAYTRADATLGGYDVFLGGITLAPTVTWSPGAETGTEASTIALGAITSGGSGLTSVVVSGIPVGDTLSDGTHSFIASSGSTSVDVLGWNDAALSITPVNDANFTLSAQAMNSSGTLSASASEAVTVNPLAPGVAPVAVSGTVGQAIALSLGITPNGKAGDSNNLSSVTLSGLPGGATLSNTAGNTLTISGGSITFSASQLAAGVLNGLALTPAAAGTFALGIAAIEQDAEGNASTTTTNAETLTVTGTIGSGGTISTSIVGPFVLAAATNPLLITSTGTVTSTGTADGVDGASGTIWSITNNGTVASAGGTGIRLSGAGTISSGGAISGVTGIAVVGGSVTNTGSIVATGKYGSGQSVGSGVDVKTTAGTVANSGIINAGAYGVALEAGGTVTNSGTLIGGHNGVQAVVATAAVVNSGTIISVSDDAIGLHHGGSVSNLAGGFVLCQGTQGTGVYINGAIGTVTNAGSIGGVDYSVYLASGGSVENDAGGVISSHRGVFITGAVGNVTNSGSIAGTTSFGVKLNNGGQVSNGVGASISGSPGVGVYGSAGTVTNNGTISGTSNAVTFSGSGANRLVVGATAVFVGNIVGSTASGSTNTLEFTGGSATLSGLAATAGSVTENAKTWSVKNFTTLAVDAGASLSMTGTNSVAGLLDSGTVDLSGRLTVTGTLDPASSGLFRLESTSTLEIATALGTQSHMDFVGSSKLIVDNFASFGVNAGTTSYAGPQLMDFGSGDLVDLKTFSSAGAVLSYTASTGVLQISNGSQLASLGFQDSTLGSGLFQAASDGASGLLISRA